MTSERTPRNTSDEDPPQRYVCPSAMYHHGWGSVSPDEATRESRPLDYSRSWCKTEHVTRDQPRA